MEYWGILLTAIGVVIAGSAAAFAWVQAHAAVGTLRQARAARDDARDSAAESARLASEANAAFTRQAEAQEEANRLKLKEMAPKDWSAPVNVAGDLWRVTNTSRRLLLVDSFDVQPENAAKFVTVRSNHEDGRYEFGDSFELAVMRVGRRAEKLTVRYRYEDDAEDDYRSFHIGL